MLPFVSIRSAKVEIARRKEGEKARRKRIIFGITKGNGKITHVQNGKYPATIPGKKGSVQVHTITLSELWRELSEK